MFELIDLMNFYNWRWSFHLFALTWLIWKEFYRFMLSFILPPVASRYIPAFHQHQLCIWPRVSVQPLQRVGGVMMAHHRWTTEWDLICDLSWLLLRKIHSVMISLRKYTLWFELKLLLKRICQTLCSFRQNKIYWSCKMYLIAAARDTERSRKQGPSDVLSIIHTRTVMDRLLRYLRCVIGSFFEASHHRTDFLCRSVLL